MILIFYKGYHLFIVQEGKHSIKDQIDKQVSDKERVLAAMENESVINVIADLIKEP